MNEQELLQNFKALNTKIENHIFNLFSKIDSKKISYLTKNKTNKIFNFIQKQEAITEELALNFKKLNINYKLYQGKDETIESIRNEIIEKLVFLNKIKIVKLKNQVTTDDKTFQNWCLTVIENAILLKNDVILNRFFAIKSLFISQKETHLKSFILSNLIIRIIKNTNKQIDNTSKISVFSKLVDEYLKVATNHESDNILFTSVEEDCPFFLEVLINKGFDINNFGITHIANISLLQLAVQENFIQMIEMLLNHGVDINYINRIGDTALHIAVENNNIAIVKILLDKGAKFLLNANKKNPLDVALIFEKLNLPLINLMIEKITTPATVNNEFKFEMILPNSKRQSFYFTALTLAVYRQQFAIARKLIAKGGNINFQFQNKTYAAIIILSLFNEENFVTFFKEFQNDLDFSIILSFCVKSDNHLKDFKLIEKFLENKEKLQLVDKAGNSYLHLAAMNAQPEMIRMLVNEYKFKDEIRNNRGYTALQILISRSWLKVKDEELVELITLLIEKANSDINNITNRNDNSLHIAVRFGNLKVIELLKKYQIKMMTDKEKNNPFHIAAWCGHSHIIFILNEIAKINECQHYLNAFNNYNLTPIMFSSNKETIKNLISIGCQLSLKNKNGEDILYIATRMYNKNILSFILNDFRDEIDKNSKTKDGNTVFHIITFYERDREMYPLMDKNYIFDYENKEIPMEEIIKKINYYDKNKEYCHLNYIEDKSWLIKPWKELTKGEIIEIIKLFLENNMNIDTVNNFNNNVLHYAIFHKDIEIFTFFLQYISKLENKFSIINGKNLRNHTPLDLAFIIDFKPAVSLLMSYNANINAITNNEKLYQCFLQLKTKKNIVTTNNYFLENKESMKITSQNIHPTIEYQSKPKNKKNKTPVLKTKSINNEKLTVVNDEANIKSKSKVQIVTSNSQLNAGKITKELKIINKTEQKALTYQLEQYLKRKQKEESDKQLAKIRQTTNLETLSNINSNSQDIQALRQKLVKLINPQIFRVRRSVKEDHYSGRPAIWVTEKDERVLFLLSSSQTTWEKKEVEDKEKLKTLVLDLGFGELSVFKEFAWVSKEKILDRWKTDYFLSKENKISVSEMISQINLEKIYPGQVLLTNNRELIKTEQSIASNCLLEKCLDVSEFSKNIKPVVNDWEYQKIDNKQGIRHDIN